MKRIGLVLFFTGYWLLATGFYTYVHAQQETLEILTYYPAPYGVYQKLDIQSSAWEKIDLIIPGAAFEMRIGATANAPWITTNALYTGTGDIWTRDTDDQPSFAYGQRTNVSQHEFRVAPMGSGDIAWTTAMVIETSGEVGIGTTSPTDILELSQDSNSTTLKIAAYHSQVSTSPTLTFRKARNTRAAPQSVVNDDYLGAIRFQGRDNTDFATGALIYAQADANWSATEGGTELYFQTRDGNDNLTTRLKIMADGHVGIANDSPSATLDVSAIGSSVAISGTSTSFYGVQGTSSSQNGVRGTSTSSTGVYGTSSSGTGVTGFSTSSYGIYGNNANGLSYAGYFDGKILATSTKSINSHIGHTYGYDIAELIPCGSDVEFNDVIIINPNKDREVIKCTKENQPAAGIISESPLVCFGDREKAREKEPDKNWNFIALAGQVMCNVDASYGEINPGDLLTTSPTPGYAMKAKPIGEINGYPIYPQGCIVGKALEPLKEGKGKILVLVCLM